jgi:hypothetical protein
MIVLHKVGETYIVMEEVVNYINAIFTLRNIVITRPTMIMRSKSSQTMLFLFAIGAVGYSTESSNGVEVDNTKSIMKIGNCCVRLMK